MPQLLTPQPAPSKRFVAIESTLANALGVQVNPDLRTIERLC